MLKIDIPITGTPATVDRPNAIITTYNVMDRIGINRNINITYNLGDVGYRTVNKLGGVDMQGDFYNEALSMVITERTEDGLDAALTPYNPYGDKIYIDREINAVFKTLYHRRTVTATYTYVNKSAAKLESVMDTLRLLGSNDYWEIYSDLEYSYIVPDSALAFIINVVDLKNNRNDVKLSVEEYIKSTFDDRARMINPRNGDIHKTQLAIKEKQMGVDGWIMGDTYTITSGVDSVTGMGSIEFGFEYIYDKPIAIRMMYQPLVYNQPVDIGFRKFNVIKGTPTLRDGRDVIRIYDLEDLIDRSRKPYISEPIDDVTITYVPPRFVTRVFSVLCIVDENDPTLLFNLGDLPCFKLQDCVSDCLSKTPGTSISIIQDHICYIQLFKNASKIRDGEVTLDVDGTLRTLTPMDIKSMYRMTFSIVNDLSYLTTNGMNNLSLCNDRYVNVFYNCYLKMLGYTDIQIEKLIEKYGSDAKAFCQVAKCPDKGMWFLVEIATIIICNTLQLKEYREGII